jgi:hypothetical protein
MITRSANIWIYIVTLILTSLAIYFVIRWRKNKPLIHHFHASSLWKAFMLNSLAASLVIFIAMATKKNFDSYTGHDNAISIILTLSTTFVTSMVAFTMMYVLFGFGVGMITPKSVLKKDNELTELRKRQLEMQQDLIGQKQRPPMRTMQLMTPQV